MTETDLEAVYAYRRLPEVAEWISRQVTSRDAFEQRIRPHLEDSERSLLLVAEFDGTLIGDANLRIEDGWGQDDLPAAIASQAEIGYILDPAYAGRGFATEIAAGLIRIGFGELGLRRLVAGCFADNLASRRVLEKAGMRLEAVNVADSLHRTQGWLDGCGYAMLADEWAGSPKRAGNE